MDKIWLEHYPAGVPAELSADRPATLVDLLEACLRKHGEREACRFMGRPLRYAQLDALSAALAATLQSLGLSRGDRVAVMLTNLPQSFIAVVAILRAGCVVVNVDPRLGETELAHQLKDCGARAIVVLENCAAVLQRATIKLPLKHVIVTATGDLFGPLQGAWANYKVRHVSFEVPAFDLPGALRWRQALARGRRLVLKPPPRGPDDIAALQYTSGTTGTRIGAVLLHRQLVSNLMQCQAWFAPALCRLPAHEQLVTVCALPLCHIYGFSLNLLLSLHLGGCSLLIAEPDNPAAMLKELARQRFHSLPGMAPMFDALARHPHCERVDWRSLHLAVAGGMPVPPATARLWRQKTGCPLYEAYGLTEASAAVTCQAVDGSETPAGIGLPLPGTEIMLLGDDGAEVAAGEPGEIAIRGPQVMAGYWQHPDETARVMTAAGFLRSGDIGVMDERGRFRIEGRKEDLIVVNCRPVWPGEVEDAIAQLPGVAECAAVGVPDGSAGEAVKVLVVRADPASGRPDEAEVRAWCATRLPLFKRPTQVEFRGALPCTAAGKVLRRALREGA